MNPNVNQIMCVNLAEENHGKSAHVGNKTTHIHPQAKKIEETKIIRRTSHKIPKHPQDSPTKNPGQNISKDPQAKPGTPPPPPAPWTPRNAWSHHQ